MREEIDIAEFVKPKRKRKKKEEKGRDIPLVSFGIILGIISIIAGTAYGVEKYANWRAGHQWQLPINWVGLVREIETPEQLALGVNKPKTDMEIIEQYHLSPVLKTIYFLESTSGKNDSCKEEGLFNGYGYRQHRNDWKCYESFEQVTDKVNEWFEERLATNGNELVEAVCFYNKGIQGLQVCDYSINFMGVLTKNF
jgi:hypothetical protein